MYLHSLLPALAIFPVALGASISSPVAAKKNSKRGLCFAEGDHPGDIKKANTTSSVLSWTYDWAQTPPDYLKKSGIEYIPMQWGKNGIETFAQQVKAQGAKRILVRGLMLYIAHTF
jgi:hypothetical protein